MAPQLKVQYLDVHPSARIADDVRISAERAVIGAECVIGSGVEIRCDELSLDTGCRLGEHLRLTAPLIGLEEGARIGAETVAELNQHFRLGRHAVIGRSCTFAGQGFSAGEFLWLRDEVVIGGGGSAGPDSFCRIGAHVTIVEQCFINVSERVEVGDHTALSRNVSILTHGAWQPVLQGYASAFAPVSVGSYVTIYLNSILLPGVSVGDYSTVSAGSVVLRDVPPHCLAGGIPARVLREDYPVAPSREQQSELVLDALRSYAATLDVKGIQIVENRLEQDGRLELAYEGQHWQISIGQPHHAGGPALTLDFGPASPAPGSAHFDLSSLQVAGTSSPLMEDLRDFLRRRAIRFSTGEPFRTLPLANLKRLKERS